MTAVATSCNPNYSPRHGRTEKNGGVWPSGLARWLVDFVLAVVGSNPSHGEDRDSHFVRPFAKGALFPSATKCSYDAYQFMVEPPQRPFAGEWGITRGVAQETSLSRKGLLKKKRIS